MHDCAQHKIWLPVSHLNASDHFLELGLSFKASPPLLQTWHHGNQRHTWRCPTDSCSLLVHQVVAHARGLPSPSPWKWSSILSQSRIAQDVDHPHSCTPEPLCSPSHLLVLSALPGDHQHGTVHPKNQNTVEGPDCRTMQFQGQPWELSTINGWSPPPRQGAVVGSLVPPRMFIIISKCAPNCYRCGQLVQQRYGPKGSQPQPAGYLPPCNAMLYLLFEFTGP